MQGAVSTARPGLEAGVELGGRYRIIGQLGEGGMGTVYEAEHTIIGRRVAVKVLHPKYCVQHDAVARFTREARAAAAIGHENIVDVTDFGTHEGQPFLVMELLRGVTLDELMVDHDQFELERAAGIVGYVLSALASAHAAGIVHRDLKPENIFLAEGNHRTTVKILDFGISKFQQTSDNLVTTEDGAMLGTPSYMSPEQWLSERDIDHRADLYAVGVLFYELLTGRLPYEGNARGELMLHVVTGTEPAPAPSSIAQHLPPEVDAVAQRAVARERSARYQTAQEFLEALRAFGAQGIDVTPALPVSAGPRPTDTFTGHLRALPVPRPMARDAPTLTETPDPSASSVVPPPVWRSPVVLVGAMGILAMLVGVGMLTRGAARPSAPALEATRPAVNPAPSTVHIDLRGLPPGTAVTLDGVAVQAPNLRLPRDNREHVLVASAGELRRELRVHADRDQVVTLDFSPPRVTAPPEVAAEPPRQPRHRGHVTERGDHTTTTPGRNRRRRHGLDIGRHF